MADRAPAPASPAPCGDSFKPPHVGTGPDRCVHAGDRESDIRELLCLAREPGTQVLVRTRVDRLALGGDTTGDAVMDDVAVQGVRAVDVRDGHSRRNGEADGPGFNRRGRFRGIASPIGRLPPHL